MNRYECPVIGSHVLGEEEPLFKDSISVRQSRVEKDFIRGGRELFNVRMSGNMNRKKAIISSSTQYD